MSSRGVAGFSTRSPSGVETDIDVATGRHLFQAPLMIQFASGDSNIVGEGVKQCLQKLSVSVAAWRRPAVSGAQFRDTVSGTVRCQLGIQVGRQDATHSNVTVPS